MIHSGAGLIKALMYPGGRGGGSDSMCILGVEGSEKKCRSPEDNFWNSPKAKEKDAYNNVLKTFWGKRQGWILS